MEEEAQQRWNRALQLSPKATSDNLSRRSRDDGVRRDMELLEEKLMRQVLRLQEQSERFMDIMMHPLEAKVAAMEGRQPVTDCSIAELRGNLRGLQESLEMQVRRAEQTETRLSKWRRSIEEDLQQKHEEMKRKFTEAVSNSDVVSRNELLELAKLLKQELRKVVDETLKDEKLATQQDLATLSSGLRRELASVEKIAAGAAAQKALGQQELANAAEAVRAEMKTLTERAVMEEAVAMEKFVAIDALEKASRESQNMVAELAARVVQCEQSEEELRLALQSQRDLPEAPDSQQTLDELTSRVAKCEALQEEFHEQVSSPHRFQASEALEESHLSRRISRLEQEQLQKGRQIASSMEELEAKLREGLAKTENLMQAAQLAVEAGRSGSRSPSETDEVVEASHRPFEAAITERLTQVESAVQALPGRLTKCEQLGEELEHQLEGLRRLPAGLQACNQQAEMLIERVAQCEGLSEASSKQAQVLEERVARCEQLSEASWKQAHDLTERVAQCEQLSEASSKPQILSERVAQCEQLSEASSKQAQVLSERVSQCEQLSQAVDTLVARLEKCEKHGTEGEMMARAAAAGIPDHPNLPGQAFAEDSSRALDGVTSRLDSLEMQQRASEDGLATAKRLNEEMESSILRRLEVLEAAEPEATKKVLAEVSSRALDGVTSRLDSLEMQLRASSHEAPLVDLASAKSLNEEMESSILRRLEALEALEAGPVKKVDAAEPAHSDESQALSDTQLMLLDLQRRVSLLEGAMPQPGVQAEEGEVVSVEPTPRTATLTQAAALIEQMELDLKHAREAAGLDLAGLPTNDSKGGTPRGLPPLAAMKVLSSPRLLQLSMTPRMTSCNAHQDAAALCGASSAAMSAYTRDGKVDVSGHELRAEIAAVWDAVAEPAEIVWRRSPPGSCPPGFEHCLRRHSEHGQLGGRRSPKLRGPPCFLEQRSQRVGLAPCEPRAAACPSGGSCG
ncbi:unnamed protein product [Symbiodinium natans]|uniref:Uncharacterized protein n=1 Tax=Symbiodinium natans TaxID=878477 RepID=A0A812TJE8_9DINO|nr:unnamed protein product [Symbiodinium natans]